MLQALVRLADRRGLFNGSINTIQQEALYWLMLNEHEQRNLLEQERMKYTILAGNAPLWQKLYAEENEDEPKDSEIEWITPQSIDEAEQIEDFLRRLHHDYESNDQMHSSDPSIPEAQEFQELGFLQRLEQLEDKQA